MSEAKRTLYRVVSNYARLLTTLCLGLVLVRWLLGAVGDEAYGLIAFLGTSAGLAQSLQWIAQRSLIRELGTALHSGDSGYFRRAFNSALVLCLGVGAVTAALLVGLIVLIAFFPVPAHLVSAARWFVLAKAVESAVVIGLSPVYNMYLITERMGWHNFWQTMKRVALTASAGWVLLVGADDPAGGVVIYGWCSAGLTALAQCIPSLLLIRQDADLWPRLSLATVAEIRSILTIGLWNALVQFALGGYQSVAGFFMFGLYGPLGGRLFGIGMQLAFYARVISTGITAGLDAVSTRISHTGSGDAIHRQMYHASRLQGVVMFPTMVATFLLAQPLITAWVGDQLQDAGVEIPLITLIVRALCVGVLAMSISEVWMHILYGAGHIRRYAPIVVAGLVGYPVVVTGAVLVLPEPWRTAGPAFAMSGVYVAAQLIGVGWVARGRLGVSVGQLLGPLVRPAVASLACVPVLLGAAHGFERLGLVALVVVGGVYGLAYAAVTWFGVLSRDERARVMRFGRSRIG